MDKTKYPFPVMAIFLMKKLQDEQLLSQEDYEIVRDLLHKYMDLRAEVFNVL